jgi:hypothetical protein
MAAMSLTQQRQTIASASTLPSADLSDHPQQSKGKRAAAPPPTSNSSGSKEGVAAYVDMVRDRKRMYRLKAWSFFVFCMILSVFLRRIFFVFFR